MPLNPDCHICHGDVEKVMTCPACRVDSDVMFAQIEKLQAQVRYLEKKTGYKYVEPQIGDQLTDCCLPGFELAEDIKRREITLEEVMTLVDDRSLQRVFREIDDITLSGVLYFLDTPEKVQRIKKNVSERHFDRLLDNVRDGWIGKNGSHHVESFLKAVRQLEEMGEIVMCRTREEELLGFYDESANILSNEERAQRQAEQQAYFTNWREEIRRNRLKKNKEIQEWFDKMGLINKEKM